MTISSTPCKSAELNTPRLLLQPQRYSFSATQGIEASESKQACGARAKQELSSPAFGKEARVEVLQKDRYGRSVGRVFVGSLEINAEMVRRGFAWWRTRQGRRGSVASLVLLRSPRVAEIRLGLYLPLTKNIGGKPLRHSAGVSPDFHHSFRSNC